MTGESYTKKVFSQIPLNAETDLRSESDITPAGLFFNRNRTEMPTISKGDWKLEIYGNVFNPTSISFPRLLSLERKSILATLECAGNGRAGMLPMPRGGEPWGHGGVSSAIWTGVPLRTLLRASELKSNAKEILFTGADDGHKTDDGRTIRYARSLGLESAADPDILVAYQMNGLDIPNEHGFPVRLYVPRMYGMASVKWLTDIEIISYNYTGFYQRDRYVYVAEDGSATPVESMRVRSIMHNVSSGDTLLVGSNMLRGKAWSGDGEITKVEISTDNGASWLTANISKAHRHLWQSWDYELKLKEAGRISIICRATDSNGNTQPSEPLWNRLGYGNNAVQKVDVIVSDSQIKPPQIATA
jgi:DMSO/TMAO reductase YedYZ molybdopterin-dependent catalytic subunit